MATNLNSDRLRDYKPELSVWVEVYNEQSKKYYMKDVSQDVVLCTDVQKFDGYGTAQITVIDRDGLYWYNTKRGKLEYEQRRTAYNELIASIFKEPQLDMHYFDITKDDRLISKFERMNYVKIFKMDIFGYWNARFTGIISSVTFNYSPGSVPSFTLQCKDLRRMLQVSEIVISRAVGMENILESFQQSLQKQLNVTSNKFAGKTGYEVIAEVLKYCNNFDKKVNNVVVNRLKMPYKNRMKCDTFTFYPGNIIFKGLNYTTTESLDYIKSSVDAWSDYIYLPDNEDFSYYVNHYAVDDSIVHGTLGGTTKITPIYEKMFRQFTEWWRNEYVTAYSICTKVSEMLFGMFYCDANGNYILSQPLLNSIPSISKDRDDDSDYNGMPSHGYNYIISDYSLLNFGVDEVEDDVYTSVEVPGAWDWGLPTGELAQLYFGYYPDQDLQARMMGVGKQEFTPDEAQYIQSLWKFGSRTTKTNPIIGITNKDTLTSIGQALYNRLFYRGYNSTYTLEGRSDLQLGRTIYNSYNNFLYLPLVITDTMLPGESHTVNLSCSYGHPIEEYIEDPWDVIKSHIATIEQAELVKKKAGNDITYLFNQNGKSLDTDTKNNIVEDYMKYRGNHPEYKDNIVKWWQTGKNKEGATASKSVGHLSSNVKKTVNNKAH